MSRDKGSTFGKYYLLKKIASGGMGEIYLAKLKGPVGFEKLLVLKRILSHHLENQEFVDMFFAEARVAAQLSHSNIVQIFEMGEIEDCYFIAMEYVSGKSFKEVIDRATEVQRDLHPAHIIEVVSELAAGMSYAHNATDMAGDTLGIIHRDINPHNLLVGYTGDVKIIDFGIAKSEMAQHKTETGTIKGKFVYMSPEQSAAEDLDKRSDLFAIGICLYEALAGKNPFAKANIVLSLDAIQRKDPPPLAELNPDFAPFDPIISKALAKKPQDRYSDCIELRDALIGLLRDGSVERPPEKLSVFMKEIFAGDIEEEKRMILATDQASTTQIEEMRAATRRDHSSSSYRRAMPKEAGAIEGGSTELGFSLSTEDIEIRAMAPADAEEERSRMPFFFALSTLILVFGLAAAVLWRFVGSPAAPAQAGVVQVVPDLGVAAKPLEGAQKDQAQSDAAAEKAAELREMRLADAAAQEATRRAKAEADLALAEKPKNPKPNRNPGHSSKSPNVPKKPSPKLPKDSAETKKPAAPPPPPPAPKKPNYGSIALSIVPPVKIVAGGRRSGQNVKLSSKAGMLVLGTGADPARDPFQVKIRYNTNAGGGILYSLSSTPWSIVSDKDGISHGNTKSVLPPVRGKNVTVFNLKNPKGGRSMRVTLRYNKP